MRVLVVLEHPEESIQPYVDTRRLHHRSIERIQLDPFRVELGQDVAVGEQHERNLPQRAALPPRLG
jgi:hypothetical protein